jgi:hypothetical protein
MRSSSRRNSSRRRSTTAVGGAVGKGAVRVGCRRRRSRRSYGSCRAEGRSFGIGLMTVGGGGGGGGAGSGTRKGMKLILVVGGSFS